jgi:hypothetical protein
MMLVNIVISAVMRHADDGLMLVCEIADVGSPRLAMFLFAYRPADRRTLKRPEGGHKRVQSSKG